jgi:putative inorganic carbon (HCO3(-)) transporter
MIEFQSSMGTRIAQALRGEAKLPLFVQWLIGIATCVLLAKLIAIAGIISAIGISGIMVVGPIVISIVWNREVGIYLVLLLAFFISIPNRLMEGIPMGIALDVLIVGSMVGLLYKSTVDNNWSVFNTPMTVAILSWACMNVAEVVNPSAASRAAWFYVIRPAVEYMMLFFLTYSALDTPRKLNRFLFSILGLSMFSACWGIKQTTSGYFQWELNYVMSHDIVHLVFNYGRWRAIGSIGSPSQFGMIMAFISMLSIALLTVYTGWHVRLFLVVSIITTLLAMVYSGTRTAYIIVPVFYFVWVILSRNKKLYFSLLLAAGIMTLIATMPTNNYHVQRIQSMFKGSEDASYQTRDRNRKMIMPWIAAHPIGGGLGSTGVWGQRFSPGTFLANFPPDSGLVRVSVELGWVGLLFFLNVYYHVLVKGSLLYWQMNNPKYKSIVAGMIAGISPLLIAEWGQEVVGVFPLSLLFWMFVAILFRAVYFDREEQLNNSLETRTRG